MILVVGGAWQGKSAYVRQRYPTVSFVEAGGLGEEELLKADGVYNLQDYIFKEMQAGRSVEGLAEALLFRNPELILTIQEVGCGVVPLDRFERRYREAVGRCGCCLAAGSREVVRLVCGIPQVIKG